MHIAATFDCQQESTKNNWSVW